jgi:aminopeptidase N
MTAKPNLTRDEARRRAELIDDVSYDVHFDLTSDDGFRSETVIRFGCREPGAETFLDHAVRSVTSIELNGRALPADAFDGTRIRLPRLQERNEVRVRSEGAYSTTGKGVSRFRDPVDDLVYVHSDFEPHDAHRGYPCFDQPDIKATFEIGATCPAGWEVVSNQHATGPPEEDGDRVRWRFERTRPMPTYITALVAGPYHVARDRHRNLDLGVYCRRSLAEHLEPEEWFEITKQGFDFFEEAFGYPYPWGDKYDQLVVPEFAAGAMENAGCVTFHERYVFRSRVTRSERELRAGTILHEMAHMWFGNLVTMRWWNDLWLNESFASFAGVDSEVRATRFTEGWASFASWEKVWALRQDQLPSTHPIVADIPDVESVHLNFDGITYAKGASVLKQLVAWVGRERFLEGMKVYFSRHELDNATLADFLTALEEASGRDLRSWSRDWLETSGVNRLGADLRLEDGRVGSLTVVQDPPDVGTGAVRPHRLAVGLYGIDGGRLVRRSQLELDVTGERTEVAEAQGEPAPDFVAVNDGDLTFARVRLDERSLETAIERLAEVEDPVTRAVTWTACWDMVRSGDLAARRYLRLVLNNAGREEVIETAETALAQALAAVSVYGDPSNRETAGQELAEVALGALRSAEPGTDHQLAWARTFVSAARSPDHFDLVRALLEGEVSFDGLAMDPELRWHLVGALVAAGSAAEELVDEELRRDPTDKGQRYAAGALAARPTPEAKSEAWGIVLEPGERTLATVQAIMRGFQQPEQDDVLAPYASRYFEDVGRVWEERELPYALAYGEILYPKFVVGEDTMRLTEAALDGTGVPGPIRRLLLEGRDGMVRTIRAREVDAAAD